MVSVRKLVLVVVLLMLASTQVSLAQVDTWFRGFETSWTFEVHGTEKAKRLDLQEVLLCPSPGCRTSPWKSRTSICGSRSRMCLATLVRGRGCAAPEAVCGAG